jgi:hypothetical protein
VKGDLNLALGLSLSFLCCEEALLRTRGPESGREWNSLPTRTSMKFITYVKRYVHCAYISPRYRAAPNHTRLITLSSSSPRSLRTNRLSVKSLMKNIRKHTKSPDSLRLGVDSPYLIDAVPFLAAIRVPPVPNPIILKAVQCD